MKSKRKSYVSPFDMFSGEIRKGEIYKSSDVVDYPVLYYPSRFEKDNNLIAKYCLPKEIVEQWEEHKNFEEIDISISRLSDLAEAFYEDNKHDHDKRDSLSSFIEEIKRIY